MQDSSPPKSNDYCLDTAGTSRRLSSLLYQTFVSYSFKYFLIWISALFVFLPLFMNIADYMETTVIASSLRTGTMYYESSILLVGFVGILAVDLSIDIFNANFGNKEMNEKKSKFMVQRMTNSEKVLLLLGLVIQPMVAFLPRTIPNLTMIWLCCHKSQTILVFCTIFLSWCRLYPDIYTPFLTSLTFAIAITGLIMKDIDHFFIYDPSVTIQSNGKQAYMVGTVLLYLAIAYFMIIALIWLYRAGRKLLRSSIVAKEIFSANKLPMPFDKAKDTEESIFSIGYMFFTWITLLIILITNSGGTNLFQLSPRELMQNNIAFIIMELCFINFHLRQVQYEAIINLCRIIEAKRAYVRYISHELRTPLNSAFLGLKLVLDQLRMREDPVEKERCETLKDVHGACMTAVDILVTIPRFHFF